MITFNVLVGREKTSQKQVSGKQLPQKGLTIALSKVDLYSKFDKKNTAFKRREFMRENFLFS